ncbi:MAG: PHP domain-containing protein [Legionella sp.]|nr:PHP domain-containing protein [Legionella sp.]
MIDLHCHSNCSDGILSPQQLLEKAIEAGVKVLALTDHDTVAGVKILQDQTNTDITFINGIELSTRWKKYDIHVLGLAINPDNALLTELIARQTESRYVRSRQIAERMVTLGISDAFEKACKIAGHDRLARPHFARVFIEEGLAADMQTAFKRFLGRGKAAYVETPWISITEAVEGITEAGGHAVLAHPLKYKLTRTKLHDLIEEFKGAGGSGLEVVSGEMTVTEVQEMAGLSQRFQLLSSSGSDYHGDTLSRISLGRQRQLPLNCIPVWHQWNI